MCSMLTYNASRTHQKLTYLPCLRWGVYGSFCSILTAPKVERAILVGVDCGKSDWSLEESMDELERLAQTDGAEVFMRLTQNLMHLSLRLSLARVKLRS